GGIILEIERRRNQDQSQRYQQQNQPFAGADFFFQKKVFAQRNEGRETGKTQGGNGNATDLDGNEEGDPVHGQHGAGDGEYAQVARRDAPDGRSALVADEGQQRDYGEAGAAGRDDHGVGLDQLAEYARKAKQHGGDMNRKKSTL